MCGRYYIASEDASEEMRALIDEVARRIREQGLNESLPEGDVYPTNIAPVIANSKLRRARAFPMRWGLPGFGGARPIINARSETAADKPTFKPLMRSRRCLVPALGYYEWEKRDGLSVKYACFAPRGIIRMAGLYRPREDGAPAEFVILTRPASPLVSFMHERMPVILSGDAADAWLDIDADPAEALSRALGDVPIEFSRADSIY